MGEVPLIVPVAEGDGDEAALPVLLRRLAVDLGLGLRFGSAYNAHGRGNLIREGGLERFLRTAAMERDCAGILVLLDAEGPCGVPVGRDLARRASGLALTMPVAVVAAVPMYEAWFLASLPSIAGHRINGQPGPVEGASLGGVNPEEIRDPKGCADRHLAGRRKDHEPSDQPAFTARMDLCLVMASCRSFRRLAHAVGQLAEMACAPQRGWVSNRCEAGHRTVAAGVVW